MEDFKSLQNDGNKKVDKGEEKTVIDMEIKEDTSQTHFQDKENSPPFITRIKACTQKKYYCKNANIKNAIMKMPLFKNH